MRKLLPVLLCCVLLGAAAPPPPYDMAATPAATAVRQHALNRCRTATGPYMRDQIDCSLAAHRGYAMATHLRDMGLFRTYADALRKAADESDAGRISPYEAQSRITRAGVAFRGTVEASYQAWRKKNPLPPGPLYDRAAFPAAAKSRDTAVTACGAWTAGITPARLACIQKAEAGFVAAIRLADRDLYYGYASVLTFTQADAQDGRMTSASMTTRHRQIWTDFLNTLQQSRR